MCLTGCSKPQDPKSDKDATSPAVKKPVTHCTAAQNPKIANVDGPKDLGCGGFAWKVWFDLDKPAEADGWMIQEITDVREIKDDKGDIVDRETVHFWEAWEVKKGKTGTVWQDQNLDDNDDAYNESSHPKTKGTIVTTGTVKFFEGPLPADFKTNNPDTMAGILHSTTKKPDCWDGTGTTHNISSTWDCTKRPATSDVTAKRGDVTMKGSK